MSNFRYRGNTVELQQAARVLRQTQTSAEEVLWEALRDRQLGGIKFRRQHSVQRFIFDFYCPVARLVIELDGSVHDDPLQQERDGERTKALESRGYRVIRFRNEEVFAALPSVLERIGKCGGAGDLMPFSPSPALFAGEGAGG